MSEILPTAILRFRALVANAHAAAGAAAHSERRLSDQRGRLHRLRADRDRLAGSRYGKPADQNEQRREVMEADAAIVEAQREADLLAAELQRLQQRRDDAARIANRCRDFLRERGALPTGLEF